MLITRRYILALAGSRLFAKFDVDRILDENNGSRPTVFSRKYIASATVTVFSLPLVSKGGVGSGYTVIEETAGAAGNTISIQFGAGSYPEGARGLNRLGFIQEAVVEEAPGAPSECAYVAFMTTSQEKNLDQARKSLEKPTLETAGGNVPYSAAQGYSGHGRISSRVDRMKFPANLTWRDIPALVSKACSEMAANREPKKEVPPAPGTPGIPTTFLYAVRTALLNPQKHTKGYLFLTVNSSGSKRRRRKTPLPARILLRKTLCPVQTPSSGSAPY